MLFPRSFTRISVFLAVALFATVAYPVACAFADETVAEKQKKLIAVVKSNDVPPQDKAIACKQLARCGGKDTVPALAALLADEKLAAWARIALEAIPDPAADKALREAATRLQGRPLIGVINSIGMRRDARAVSILAAKSVDPDGEVASAAAVALGRIGGDAAARMLRSSLINAPAAVRSAAAEGCILCAERSDKVGDAEKAVELFDVVRQADVPEQRVFEATRGAILSRKSDGVPLLLELLRSDDRSRFELGLWVTRELPGRKATDALVSELERMTPERQALLMLALMDRADRPPLTVVVQAAKQGPKNVRMAAIKFLQRHGDASCVPALLAAVVGTDADVSAVAAEALEELPGEDVDARLAARLPKAEGKERRILIELAGQRRIAAAMSDLLKASDDTDDRIRAAALQALGATIDFASLPPLIDRMVQAKTLEEMGMAADAVKAASGRMPDREACAEKLAAAMLQCPVPAKCKLLESLGAVGGAKALAAIVEASKDTDVNVQGAAIAQLGDWMTPDAAPALLESSKKALNDRLKTRALRGYLRIARQFVMSADARLGMFHAAMETAQRDNERRLALEVLTRIPSTETLNQATERLGDPQLKDAAADAAVKIAAKLITTQAKAVDEAMRMVLDSNVGDRLKAQAKQLQDQVRAAVK